MTFGPIQLVVLGFERPDFRGDIFSSLEQLYDENIVRVVDGVVVYKDSEGKILTMQASQLNRDDRMEFGEKVSALIGLGQESSEAGAYRGSQHAADGTLLPVSEMIDVLSQLPVDSAAAVVLIEHRWAIPLRDAVYRSHGYNVFNTFVSPQDLVHIGLAFADDAEHDDGEDRRATTTAAKGLN